MASARPNILFLGHTAVLGGGELSLLDIARYFGPRGKVLLFSDGPLRERLEAAGVKVQMLEAQRSLTQVSRSARLWKDLAAVPGLLRLARDVARQGSETDLFYANSQKTMFVAAIAGLLTRKPVIWHLRDIMTAEHFGWFHRNLAVQVASLLVRRVIANSESTRRCFIDSGGSPDRIRVVYNGIRAADFDVPGARAAGQRARAALGLQGVPTVGIFSRLAQWKGQHVLIEALAAAPGVHALLVGEALFEVDKAYVEELHRLAARLGVSDRVHFLGFRQDVGEFMQACDLVLHTSVAPEPFGRVIVEGLLAGRPVIATAAGGAMEILTDGVTGRLVPPGDASALAGAICALIADPSAAQAMAARGGEAVRARFSLEAMVEGVERQIADVLQPVGPGR